MQSLWDASDINAFIEHQAEAVDETKEVINPAVSIHAPVRGATLEILYS